jgi:hypothetical protein
MASERKFYKLVVTVTVLSEEPIGEEVDLESIAYGISQGDWSGQTDYGTPEEVDGPTMARLLQEQGSDTEFFLLSEEGEDLDDGDLDDGDESANGN